MLDTPSEKTNRILDFATFVENLGDGLYDQSTFGHYGKLEPKCLCGWINEHYLGTSYTSDTVAARHFLGLDTYNMNLLFEGGPYWGTDSRHPTAAEAASVLRHLAITGKVDWQRAKAKTKEEEPALASK